MTLLHRAPRDEPRRDPPAHQAHVADQVGENWLVPM
jgi:hypothetical protein